MTSYASQKYEGIVICDEDSTNVLRQPSLPISAENWEQARLTVQKLLHIRENILKGGAGLAAAQIGIPLPIFIFTPDRTTESLRIAINPSFEPMGMTTIEGHEACFSVPLRSTKLKRWEKIKVKYQNLEGKFIEEVLDGFAAKVFQHEMDHVNGKLTIDHPSADVLTFSDPQAFQDFMKKVHQEDARGY